MTDQLTQILLFLYNVWQSTNLLLLTIDKNIHWKLNFSSRGNFTLIIFKICMLRCLNATLLNPPRFHADVLPFRLLLSVKNVRKMCSKNYNYLDFFVQLPFSIFLIIDLLSYLWKPFYLFNNLLSCLRFYDNNKMSMSILKLKIPLLILILKILQL